jgi:hypothetical protein
MTPPLSLYELRVLKAVQDRAGGTTVAVIGQMTDYCAADIEASLRLLLGDGLVTSDTITRTGATWWRITSRGTERLIATPPPRFQRRRGEGDQGQLDLGVSQPSAYNPRTTR